MTLLEKVQYLCEQKSITVYRLEQETNLTKGSIRKWNESLPSSDKLYKVSQYFGVTMESLLEDKENIDFKQIKFLDKLITATNDKKVRWFKCSIFNDLKYHAQRLSDIFSLSSYDVFDSHNQYVVERDSFYLPYKTGGYLLAAIKDHRDSNYTIIAFFIYFDGIFTLYATNDHAKILNELLKSVKAKVLGLDYLVNSFLQDDFKSDSGIKNCLFCGKPLDPTKDRNGMCQDCRIKYTEQD